jgi:hypothetical protein
MNPNALDGPACHAPGPTVEATPRGFGTQGRKPPAGSQRYDLRVRNPSAYHVWLVLEGYGDFPAALTSLTVERNRTEPSIYVWSLDALSAPQDPGARVGSASNLRAFYVAPDTDVLLRNVVVQTVGPPETLPVRFVDTMYIAGRWAQDWLGHDATLPPRGDVPLTDEWERVMLREPDSRECLNTEPHVLCVQDLGTGGRRE